MRYSLKLAALSSTLLFAVSPVHAHGGSDQKAAFNQGGQPVVSTNGACVRTKWDAANDICAPEPEPAPVKKPVVQKPKPTPQPERDARTIYFDFNSARLTETEQVKLDKLVSWLATSKGVTGATVYGYADQIGSVDYNEKLSAKRAAAVEAYLATKGVVLPTNVEIVKGLGETGSLTSCDDSMPRAQKIKCLAADRRVEVMFETLR